MSESEFRQRELEHVRRFVAGRDVPCPKCDYNLRDLERGECPECGLRLTVESLQRAERIAIDAREGAEQVGKKFDAGVRIAVIVTIALGFLGAVYTIPGGLWVGAGLAAFAGVGLLVSAKRDRPEQR